MRSTRWQKIVPLCLLLIPLDQGIAQKPIRREPGDRFSNRSAAHSLPSPSVSSDSVFTVLGHWAWGPCEAVDASGKYAYIGNGQTLHVLDISNPASPVIVGEYVTDGYVYDIKVRDNLAFVAVGGGLLILDVSNPSSPVRLGEAGIAGQLIQRIALADSFAYVSGQPGGVFVVEVTNPASPRVRGSLYPGGELAECFTARNRYMYFGSHEITEITVLNANNPDSIRWGYFDIGGFAASGFVRDTLLFLYMTDYSGMVNWLQVFSVARPDTGILLGQVEIGKCIRGSVSADSTTAYVTTDSGQVISVDITDPSTPVVKDRHAPSAWELQGGRAIATSPEGLLVAQWSGLRIVHVSGSDSLTNTAFFPTGGLATKIFLRDNLAFVASYFSGLWILDITNPQEPRSISNVNVGSYAVDVIASDTIVYLANYAALYPDDTARGLWTIDIADVHYPHVLSHYIGIAREQNPVQANSIGKLGDFIVMTQVGSPSNDSTLEIIDVSNPAQPVRASVFRAKFWPFRVTIKDSIAYIANADSGIRIIDLHNPRDPRQLNLVRVEAIGIAVRDSFAYALSGYITAVNVADPLSPLILDTTLVTLGVTSMDGAIAGDYLYWASQDLGVVDISNPRKPIPKGTFDYAYSGEGVAVSAEKVYLADQWYGVWILQNNLVTSVEAAKKESVPEKIQLLQNYPNPFNPQTVIEFSIPKQSRVVLEIYNVLGQRVASPLNAIISAGRHTIRFDGSRLASGVYLCRLSANGMTITKKLVMCK